MTIGKKKTNTAPIVGSHDTAALALRYGVLAFAVFALCMVIKMPGFEEVVRGRVTLNFYLLDYSLGFHSRFLIGSIVSLLTRRVTWKFIYWFVVASLLTLSAVLSVWLGKVMARVPEEERFGAQTLFALFLASPSSITHLFPHCDLGRFDLYLTLFAVLICVCAPRRRLCWLVPVLCVLAVLTHHIFFLLFMPYVGIIMLYEIYRSGFSKKYVAIFVLTVVLSSALTAYFQFFQFAPGLALDFADANELADYIARTRDIDTESMAFIVNLEYFLPLSKWYDLIVAPIISHIWWKYPLAFAIMQFPALAVLFALWRGSLGDKKDKLRLLVGILCLISPLTLIITCAGANDWDRWFNLTLFAHFMLAFYFIGRRDAAVTASVKKIGAFFDAKPALLVATVCWGAIFNFSDLQHSTYLFYDTGYFIDIMKSFV